MKETTASPPGNNGQGRRPGHRHPLRLLPPDREWGAPPATAGNSPVGLTTGRREDSAHEGRRGRRESVLRHCRRAGLCRQGLFPFIRGETGSPSALTLPPSVRTRPTGRSDVSNAPGTLIGHRAGAVEAAEVRRTRAAQPLERFGAPAPPPARARTFYSPLCRPAKAWGGGQELEETEKEI